MAVQLRKIIRLMESFAPPELAESWDNSGLLLGNPDDEIQSAMVTLDVTMENVDYAAHHNIDLIISHHPVIFNKLAAIRTDTYDGRLLQKLLVHHIAVYSAHTNWDSAEGGVNDILAEQIGLKDVEGLIPVKQEALYKFVVYVPSSYEDIVRQALGEAGAGFIGKYSHCMFSVAGEGQFKPLAGTHPFIGAINRLEKTAEIRVETIIPESRLSLVVSAVKMVHPYEEPAFDIYPMVNKGKTYALGRIGSLNEPEEIRIVLRKIKRILHIQILSYAGNESLPIKKIALCGGAGASFLKQAKQAGADLYLTGDVKYHEAQEAVKLGMVIADGGHFGTERPSMVVLLQRLQAASIERNWEVVWKEDSTSCDIFKHC